MLVTPYMMIKMLASVSFLKQKYKPAEIMQHMSVMCPNGKAPAVGKIYIKLTREEEHQDLQIKVERTPCGGLMLRDGGNDGDVILGIGGIQKGVETASPGRDLAQSSGNTEGGQASNANHQNQALEEELELLS